MQKNVACLWLFVAVKPKTKFWSFCNQCHNAGLSPGFAFSSPLSLHSVSFPMLMNFIASFLPSTRCSQTFLPSFQFLPLPSPSQSPHSLISRSYSGPGPLFLCHFVKVALCFMPFLSSLHYLHSVICYLPTFERCLMFFCGLWIFCLSLQNCLFVCLLGFLSFSPLPAYLPVRHHFKLNHWTDPVYLLLSAFGPLLPVLLVMTQSPLTKIFSHTNKHPYTFALETLYLQSVVGVRLSFGASACLLACDQIRFVSWRFSWFSHSSHISHSNLC